MSFPRIPGSACRFSPTPFAGKLEAALRLAGIPFSGKHGDLNNPKQAPRRKVRVARRMCTRVRLVRASRWTLSCL